jgi:dTDP-4-dehydrorhamnose 3,5-epimerase
VLSDEVDFVYKCSDFYTPDDEYGIRWDDPDIGIDWPMTDVQVSGKDQAALFLKDVPVGNLPD